MQNNVRIAWELRLQTFSVTFKNTHVNIYPSSNTSKMLSQNNAKPICRCHQ